MLTVFLVVLMVIPSSLIFTPLGAAGTPATLVGVVLFIWYLLTWLNPAARLARGRQPIRFAGLMFLCTVLLTYLSASRHAMPTSELNGLDRGPILAVGWLGVLLVAADGIESMAGVKKLLRRIVTGGTILSIFGILQATTGINVANYIVIPGLSADTTYAETLVRGNLIRPSVTTINPLEFAAVVSICLPLAIYQARNYEPSLRARHWLQVAIIGVAQVMTTSRTSILALMAVCLVLLPAWTAWERRRAYVAIIVSAFGLFLVVHGLLGTIKNLFVGVTSSDSSTASRTSAWTSAEPFIAAHPWFGRGFGTFFPATYFFTDDQYLSSIIETGFVGVLVLIGLLATGWFTARSVRRMSTDRSIRDLAQCMAASVAVAAVSFGTFDALSFPMMASLTFLLLGCVGALWRLSGSDAAATVPQPALCEAGEGSVVGASVVGASADGTSADGTSVPASTSGWRVGPGAWDVLRFARRLTDTPSTISGMPKSSTSPKTTTAASGRIILLIASVAVSEEESTVSLMRFEGATSDCKIVSCEAISLVTAPRVDCAFAGFLSVTVIISTGPGEVGASTTR